MTFNHGHSSSSGFPFVDVELDSPFKSTQIPYSSFSLEINSRFVSPDLRLSKKAKLINWKQLDMQPQKLSTFQAVVRRFSLSSLSSLLFGTEKQTSFPIAILKGTVNDPTTFPPSSRSHGSYHWAFERLLSASLVPLTAAAFVTSGSNYPVLDGLFGVGLIMHSHIGVRPFLSLSKNLLKTRCLG